MPIPIDGGIVKYTKPGPTGKPDGLGNKVESMLKRFLVGVIEDNDESLARILSYSGESLLENLETGLVPAFGQIADFVVSQPGCPEEVKELVNRYRNPKNQVEIALMVAIIGAVIVPVIGSTVGPISNWFAQQVSRIVETNIPAPSVLYDMVRRGNLSLDDAQRLLDRSGIEDGLYHPWSEVSRPVIDVPSILEGYRRGTLDWSGQVLDLLSEQGYRVEDFPLFKALAPTLLDMPSIVTAFRRDKMTQAEAQTRLTHLGFTPDNAGLLLEIQEPIPGAADLILMAVREAWRDDVASTWGYDEDFPGEFAHWLSKQGYDPEWAMRYWRSHWRLPSVSLGYEMLHRGIIGSGELETLLKISDYPAGWRDKMLQVSYSPLTRVDVRRMYGLGVLDLTEVKGAYLDLGYNDLNADRMTAFTELYVNKDDSSKVAEARELTRSVIESAYRKAVITRAEAETRLGGIGYLPEDIDLLLSMIDAQRELDAVPDYIADYQRDLQRVVLRSYTKRLIGETEAKSYLSAVGLGESEIEVQLAIADFEYAEAVRNKQLDIIGESYVRRAIDRTRSIELLGRLSLPSAQQNQVLAEWEAERQLRTRRLTESQYRKALGYALITVDEYAENLRGLGYTEPDIAILVGMATYVKE